MTTPGRHRQDWMLLQTAGGVVDFFHDLNLDQVVDAITAGWKECSLYGRRMAGAMYLHADRQPDGTRTFRLVEGEPLATSFGEDLYKNIFAVGAAEINAG